MIPETDTHAKAVPANTVRVITKEVLNKKIQANDRLQIVNVLDPQHYPLGFIKGSQKIPLDQLEARIGELDKSKEVVTYCASHECNASKHAAQLLADRGFRVSAYEGGVKEWKASGLPMDAS